MYAQDNNPLPVWSHNLSLTNLLISQPILVHFWWELYQGGKQVIPFLDGYATPLQCRSGLMYMSILGKPTDQDFDECPHVLLTSPHKWDPSVLHYSHPNTRMYPSWPPEPSARDQHYPRIDECGNINHRSIHTPSILSGSSTLIIQKHDQKPTDIDYNKLKPHFGGVNADTIQKTFENTTQWATAPTRFPMRKHFQSRFPAFNIPRRNEAVATDTIFSDTPAIDSGVTMAQIFVGKDTLASDVYVCNPPNNLYTLWRIIFNLGEL